MLPIAFSPTDPRCHGNEIWDKMGYNSACAGGGVKFPRHQSRGQNSNALVYAERALST